jgi:hypothetical protein
MFSYVSPRTVEKASPHMQTVTIGTGVSQQVVLVILMPLAAPPYTLVMHAWRLSHGSRDHKATALS